MNRGDGVQLKLNRVKIDTNKLSAKPLQKIIEFLAECRTRELIFLEEVIDVQPLSSCLEEFSTYKSKVHIGKLSKLRRFNYSIHSLE
jgi:hypothetical protein